jgi:hypothetical protein
MMSRGRKIGIALVTAWVRFYTRDLPSPIAAQRQAEIESDLWEQLHDPDRHTPTHEIVVRLLAGIPDDLRWKEEQMEPGEIRKAIFVTLGATAVAALLLMGMMTMAAASLKPPPVPAAPVPEWQRKLKSYPPPPPPPPPPQRPPRR